MAERIYNDLESAGRELATTLATNFGNHAVVLAVANAGAPVAVPVADRLNAHLDLIVIRRLFVREGRPWPICAVSIGGNLVVDQEAGRLSHIEEQFMKQSVDELCARARAMRYNFPPTDIAGKNVVVVDNGIHTGSTIQIAATAVRTLRPASITVAVPVADAKIRSAVLEIADDVLCLKWAEQFGHTGLWYKNFNRPGDDEVRTIMNSLSLEKNKRQ